MQDIAYIGEHLLPGKLGHLLLVLAFCTGLLSVVAYYFSTARRANAAESASWSRIGRTAFYLCSGGIIGVVAVMFFMMLRQYYEYEYVWSHVSEELPFKYIFSAFWEGQQGSFLLWMFWHAVLGVVLLRTAGKWEAPTMAILALVQVFLVSMILGIYFTPDVRLGVTPFALLRETEGMTNLPIFTNANYLDMIEGKGLNPLLQNYWMTIHPPTLFLGFASVTIPFCFGVAGLWTRDYRGWMKPVLPWALFSLGILGTGIVMGGAWAYEALSFGGYWAWDPVENASLVPWLILVGGVHTNLVAKSTGHSVKATYVLYGLAFIFVLYSTFLTRSGILGDSSVHAFTEMGLEWQLVIFMAAFVLMGIWQYFRHARHIPSPDKEEAFSSREFWMFIGSLVLLFSAGLITFTTSLPVINKLMDVYGSVIGRDVSDWHWASPEDPMEHYNRFQIWIAVFVGLLSGGAQFLIYKEKNWTARRQRFWQRVGISLGAAAVAAILVNLWIRTASFPYLAMIFSAVFAVIANALYLGAVLKYKMKSAASVIAHAGFGLMILGILASGINKTFISNNAFAMRGIFAADDESLYKNVFLIKGQPLYMGGYMATYVSDTLIDFDRHYRVQFAKLAEDNKTVTETFELQPRLTYNRQLTQMVNPNPSTKRYLHKDFFSHITSVPPHRISAEAARAADDSLNYQLYDMTVGDTLTIGEVSLRLENIMLDPEHPEYEPDDGDLAYGLEIQAWDKSSRRALAYPVLAIKEQRYVYSFYDQLNDLGVRFRLTEEGLAKVYQSDQQLDYQMFKKKQGDRFDFEGYQVFVSGFDKDPAHPSYTPEEGDIAVAVNLEVITPAGQRGLARPIFLIRDNRTYFIKDQQPLLGLAAKFTSIDPATETLDILLARVEPGAIPVQIAVDAPRDDYIVLEAIEFPGINLFWLGTIMMMGGAFLGMARRIRS